MTIRTPDSPHWKEYGGNIGNLPGNREEYVVPNVVEPVMSRNASLITLWNPLFLQCQTFASSEDAREEIAPSRDVIEKALKFRKTMLTLLASVVSLPSDSTHSAAYGGPNISTINMGPIRFPRVKSNIGEPWPFGHSVVEMMLGTLKQIAETKQKNKGYGLWPVTCDNIVQPFIRWLRPDVTAMFGKQFQQKQYVGAMKQFATIAKREDTETNTIEKLIASMPAILTWVPADTEWSLFDLHVQDSNPEGDTLFTPTKNPAFDPDTGAPVLDTFVAIELDGQFYVGKVIEIKEESSQAVLVFDGGEEGTYSYGSLLSSSEMEFDEF